MDVELSEKEREILVALLEKRTGELLHELHHAVRNEYKAALRRELEEVQALAVKMGAPIPA